MARRKPWTQKKRSSTRQKTKTSRYDAAEETSAAKGRAAKQKKATQRKAAVKSDKSDEHLLTQNAQSPNLGQTQLPMVLLPIDVVYTLNTSKMQHFNPELSGYKVEIDSFEENSMSQTLGNSNGQTPLEKDDPVSFTQSSSPSKCDNEPEVNNDSTSTITSPSTMAECPFDVISESAVGIVHTEISVKKECGDVEYPETGDSFHLMNDTGGLNYDSDVTMRSAENSLEHEWNDRPMQSSIIESKFHCSSPARTIRKDECPSPARTIMTDEFASPARTIIKGECLSPAGTIIKGEYPSPARTIIKDDYPSPARTIMKDECPSPSIAIIKGEYLSPARTIIKGESLSPASTIIKDEYPSPARTIMKDEFLSPTRAIAEEENFDEAALLSDETETGSNDVRRSYIHSDQSSRYSSSHNKFNERSSRQHDKIGAGRRYHKNFSKRRNQQRFNRSPIPLFRKVRRRSTDYEFPIQSGSGPELDYRFVKRTKSQNKREFRRKVQRYPNGSESDENEWPERIESRRENDDTDSEIDYGWEDPAPPPSKQTQKRNSTILDQLYSTVAEKMRVFHEKLNNEYDLDVIETSKKELYDVIEELTSIQSNEKLSELDEKIRRMKNDYIRKLFGTDNFDSWNDDPALNGRVEVAESHQSSNIPPDSNLVDKMTLKCDANKKN